MQAIDDEKVSLRHSLLTANQAAAAAQARLEREIGLGKELQHRCDELSATCLALEDRVAQSTGLKSTLTEAMKLGVWGRVSVCAAEPWGGARKNVLSPPGPFGIGPT